MPARREARVMVNRTVVGIGFALLLAIPPGVGVAVAVLMTRGTTVADPLAVGAGALTATVVFLVSIAGALHGSPDLDLEP